MKRMGMRMGGGDDHHDNGGGDGKGQRTQTPPQNLVSSMEDVQMWQPV